MDKNRDKGMLVLGLMSGTSLDGLDMALCRFERSGKGFKYEIVKARTIHYSKTLKQELSSLKNAGAEEYFAFDARYGRFVAAKVKAFLKEAKLVPEIIASHGHTVFHQPAKGFTTQIGNGAQIAAATGIITVCDFRSLDVALGGQGAPLVPLGDRLLFGNYDACLNIGGIANVSFEKKSKQLAYDICESNMLLNYLAEKCGRPYDKDGKIAASGKVNKKLFEKLNSNKYYRSVGARSIGREWFEKNVLEHFQKSKLILKDQMATATDHIAQIVASDLNKNSIKNVLITGGGALNKHLVKSIRAKTKCELIIPSSEVINFKEALIFAFLGYLRVSNTVNTLSSVTGAKRDSIGGAVYYVKK